MSNEPCTFIVSYEEPGFLTPETSTITQGFHTWKDALAKCYFVAQVYPFMNFEIRRISGQTEKLVGALMYSHGKLVYATLL